MALLVTDAIVLHAFDYLESSRIVRLVTREAGLRSALAKGARRSRRRFGGALDLFAQGSAQLHVRPGRDLDTMSAFEDVRSRETLAHDLERFAGAEMIAEILLRLGGDGGDAALFDTVEHALDTIASANPCDAREAALAGAWGVVGALGVEPSLVTCAGCDVALPDDAPVPFSYVAGGALCVRCAATSAAERILPADARSTLVAWLTGGRSGALTLAAGRAHQRLLREFISFHLHDGRPLRAFELWETGVWGPAAAE